MTEKFLILCLSAVLLPQVSHSFACGGHPDSAPFMQEPVDFKESSPLGHIPDLDALDRYVHNAYRTFLTISVEDFKEVLQSTRQQLASIHDKSGNMQQFEDAVDDLLNQIYSMRVEEDLKIVFGKVFVFPLEYYMSNDQTMRKILYQNGMQEFMATHRENCNIFTDKVMLAIQSHIQSLTEIERIEESELINMYEKLLKLSNRDRFKSIPEFIEKFLFFKASVDPEYK